MPIPKPNEDEEQQEFISRCMGDETMKEDYPERDQRLAICFDSWRKDHGDEAKMGRGFSVKSSSKEAEIYLYEEIGSGWFGGVSSKQFQEELSKAGKVDKITLRLNSPGGDVFDGLAIYNLLRQNPARVLVYVDGLAASIASIIAMSGDEIRMAENAMMMIHNPWTMALGDSEEMRNVAERLDKVAGQLVRTYAKRTGKSEDYIANLMNAETWMTGMEAFDMGFVDSVVEELKIAAHFDLTKFKFRNTPKMEREVPLPPSQKPDPRLEAILKRHNQTKKEHGGK